MIQTETILKAVDNSGAKTVKCIKVLSNAKYAHIGDCILVSVRSVRSAGAVSNKHNARRAQNIKKGQIFKALVIRTKKGITGRRCGHEIAFQSNDVVLIQGDGNDASTENLIGSRIFGPITRELRAKNYRKIISKSRKRML